ncbi:ABC transporter permease [Natronosporangium hydrolyticum]|uniref:Transport permease protein n=1 Tax=Natronosporangium hydrolyticum TaxID=2811111 RepID=A0A895YIR7_9ACTN|nr:ABC transporter permease [Natronosporangium hydrolyticum]QSB14020.1 ABC transporter permease [Natronosporangium hydrolyticum]
MTTTYARPAESPPTRLPREGLAESERIRHVLVAPQDRPERATAFSASLTYGWRALQKIKHLPEQLFDVTIFPIMMTVMFTFIFGGAIGGSVSNYVQFLIPGIFVQTLIMITMYTGLTLNKDFSKGVFDRFRSLPVWRPAQLVGALLGDQVRYLLAGTIMLGIGFLLGFRPDGGLIGVAAAFLLLLIFSFSLSWVWTTVSLAVRTEQAAMGVSMFVLMPLTFASNIFVDPQTMPSWLQGAVEVNPVSIVVTAVRELMNGVYSASSIGLVGLCCLVLIASFGPLSMSIYNRKS